jgi:uncharacterized protein
MKWIGAMLAIALALTAGRAMAQANANDWYTVAMAASHNDLPQVRALLLQGGSLDRVSGDVVDSYGRSALDYAASFNNLDMAKLLVDHGAKVNGHDPSGDTALHAAAERGNLEIIRFLLDQKAIVDAVNREGVTPLMAAISHSQIAAVRVLLQNGANPKKQDYTGRDAFGWAAGKPPFLQALKNPS